jgi:tRNA(fMet)-specific endonuclease VapC
MAPNRILIDTNIYSALNRGDAAVVSLFSRTDLVAIPPAVIAELLFGFYGGSNRFANERELDMFLHRDTVEIVPVGRETARIYAEISTFCRKSGKALSNHDLWIAASALEHGIPLVTFDKDFMGLQRFFTDGMLQVLTYSH